MFTKQDSLIEKLVLNENGDSLRNKEIKRVKVSPNNELFLIYEERYDEDDSLLGTEIVFYTADKKELWKETRSGARKLSYHLSNVYDNLFVIADTDKRSKNPNVYIIKDGRMYQIVEKDSWRLIFNYKISGNYRYVVMHCRKPYFNRLWDYIYSIDLEARTDWEYLFPVCTTCKRGKITFNIDDNGEVEVIYRKKHRVFSNEGKLINAFIKIE